MHPGTGLPPQCWEPSPAKRDGKDASPVAKGSCNHQGHLRASGGTHWDTGEADAQAPEIHRYALHPLRLSGFM